MVLFLCFCCAAFVGCNDGRPADMPKLHPVTLTFILDDVPLADAPVMLHSANEYRRWAVGGRTDAGGLVSLKTQGRYPGAPAGKYKITVDKVVQSGPPVPPSSELPDDEEECKKIFDEIDKKTATTRVVDEKFLDRKTTPLEYEVVTGKNEERFDLGKSVNIVLVNN